MNALLMTLQNELGELNDDLASRKGDNLFVESKIMSTFRSERTADFVQRLVKQGNAKLNATILTIIILIAVAVSLGVRLSGLLVSIDPSISMVLSTILGAAIGYLVGSVVVAVIVSTLEWMAQILIIQSELLSNSKLGV